MTSLAYSPKPSEKDELPKTAEIPSNPSRPQFPTMRMNGEQAKKAGLEKCNVADEYEMTVRVRAKRIGLEDWDSASSEHPSVELDVISATPAVEVESEAEDNAEPEEEDGPVKRQKGIKSPREAGLKGGYGK